jgi:hypothetical protein
MSDFTAEAREMAAVFIGYTARGNFDAVTLDDLEKWFDIDQGQAMEVLYQIGSANLSIHFEGCECGETEPDFTVGFDDDDEFGVDDETWNMVVPGDPDPTPLLAVDDYDCCMGRNGGWGCTRPEGHSGQHVAGDGDEVCAVWL